MSSAHFFIFHVITLLSGALPYICTRVCKRAKIYVSTINPSKNFQHIFSTTSRQAARAQRRSNSGKQQKYLLYGVGGGRSDVYKRQLHGIHRLGQKPAITSKCSPV